MMHFSQRKHNFLTFYNGQIINHSDTTITKANTQAHQISLWIDKMRNHHKNVEFVCTVNRFTHACKTPHLILIKIQKR